LRKRELVGIGSVQGRLARQEKDGKYTHTRELSILLDREYTKQAFQQEKGTFSWSSRGLMYGYAYGVRRTLTPGEEGLIGEDIDSRLPAGLLTACVRAVLEAPEKEAMVTWNRLSSHQVFVKVTLPPTECATPPAFLKGLPEAFVNWVVEPLPLAKA
jgi:hypothetical protein